MGMKKDRSVVKIKINKTQSQEQLSGTTRFSSQPKESYYQQEAPAEYYQTEALLAKGTPGKVISKIKVSNRSNDRNNTQLLSSKSVQMMADSDHDSKVYKKKEKKRNAQEDFNKSIERMQELAKGSWNQFKQSKPKNNMLIENEEDAEPVSKKQKRIVVKQSNIKFDPSNEYETHNDQSRWANRPDFNDSDSPLKKPGSKMGQIILRNTQKGGLLMNRRQDDNKSDDSF